MFFHSEKRTEVLSIFWFIREGFCVLVHLYKYMYTSLYFRDLAKLQCWLNLPQHVWLTLSHIAAI